MKKLTSLIIGCSLAFAGIALAQQPDEQPSPGKKEHGDKAAPGQAKRGPNADNAHGPAAGKPGANSAAPGAPAGANANADAPKTHGAGKHAPAAKAPAAAASPAASVVSSPAAPAKGKGKKGQAAPTPSASASAGTDASAASAPSATPAAKPGRPGKGGKTPPPMGKASPAASAAPSGTPAAKASASPAASASPSPVAAASASAAPATAPVAQAPAGAPAKKPDPQQVQQIKQQHKDFHAQPRPDRVPAVTFHADHRIQGSEQWQGAQYEVYRSYRPERHDQGWYRSHYNRVELIGGGYYYWNNGYWYPAWGYSPREEYYAYDAPIYVGHRAEPPDRVIADVQATLQQMGYYKGEVDGLLGPLTREALTGYQHSQGLMATAVIDQPTLDSLGMG